MKVQLHFQTSKQNVIIPEDSSLGSIQKEVEKLFNVPQKQQKIIFRGTQLKDSNEKLKNLKVNDGAKLLILQQNAHNEVRKKRIRNTRFGHYFFPPEVHFDESIIAQGPPKGAIKGYIQDVLSLPESPFVVRSKDGISKLSVETDALFLLPDKGDPRRVFFSELRCVSVMKIGDELYSALSLTTKGGDMIYVYFVPSQYVKFLLQTVAGRAE